MSVNITKTGGSAPKEQTINVTVAPQDGADAPTLPATSNLILIAGVAAVVAWGVTQIVKAGVRGFTKSKKKTEDPWWLSMALRLTSCVVGGCAGLALFSPLEMSGAVEWGVAVGAGGGALATVIVAAIKSRIRGAGNAKKS